MTKYFTLQASTLKQRLGMQKFGNFIAGLFTAKKSAKRSSGTVTACILCFFNAFLLIRCAHKLK